MTEFASLFTGIVGGGVFTGSITVWLCKKYIKDTDLNTKTLPVVTQSIEMLTNCMTTMKENIKELMESRNEADKRLERIDTIHEVLGCIDKAKRK